MDVEKQKRAADTLLDRIVELAKDDQSAAANSTDILRLAESLAWVQTPWHAPARQAS